MGAKVGCCGQDCRRDQGRRSFVAVPATFLMLLAASAATAQTGKVVYRDVTDSKRVVRIEGKDELLLARTIAIRCYVSSGTVAAMNPPENVF